ncbi:hypothetical protein PYW07_000263 [Mythimna separata]|uniref:ZAD domain-containing protein n=1 Tax=Mythimna separata TaxID=271217 RepID=A0AAD8E1D0_MYTSE|nr:hypothetical protein PYW07_000263 [Mythimna separata]
MGETTDAEKVDLRASDIEACRICLETDVKLHSLQDTRLGICLKSIGGFTKSIEGLPNFVCYECAPILIKCNKLLEKGKIAESTLQEIFFKNGRLTKLLIKEQKNSDPQLQSPLDSYLKLNYYYMRHEDNSSISRVTKNETKEESSLGDEMTVQEQLMGIINNLTKDKEVVKNIKFGRNNETIPNVPVVVETINNVGQEEETIQDLTQDEDNIIIDCDAEPTQADGPVIEIVSDDDKMGEDDFDNSNTYAVGEEDTVDEMQPYDYGHTDYDYDYGHTERTQEYNPRGFYYRQRMPPWGYRGYRRRRYQDGDKFVRRYFSIHLIQKPGRRPCKRYFCMYCPEAFNYLDDARDHVVKGCRNPDDPNNQPEFYPATAWVRVIKDGEQ